MSETRPPTAALEQALQDIRQFRRDALANAAALEREYLRQISLYAISPVELTSVGGNDGEVDFDHDRIEEVAQRNGLTLVQVMTAAQAIFRSEDRKIGISGQTVRVMSIRHVEMAIAALAACKRLEGSWDE